MFYQIGDAEIFDSERMKMLNSPSYSFLFRKMDGFFVRTGQTIMDDPTHSIYGPEIADIEISSASKVDLDHYYDVDKVSSLRKYNIITKGGCNSLGCRNFCYKQNISNQTIHMSLELFQHIMKIMPKTLTQIAFGICSTDSHPQMWEIFQETIHNNIVPNVTINGIGVTNNIAEKLSNTCGAVAVSVNQSNKEIAYNTIDLLSNKYGMRQINIHIVLAEDTVPFIKSVFEDAQKDSRLKNLNAIVMLSFKDKANTNCYKSVQLSTYINLIEFCEKTGISFGFDSCSAKLYLKAIQNRENCDELSQFAEPCESGLFSIYINVFGHVYPCSFYEGCEEWNSGIQLLGVKNQEEFLNNVWNSSRLIQWKNKLLNNERSCPLYQIGKV
jgi:hypothetical protein